MNKVKNKENCTGKATSKTLIVSKTNKEEGEWVNSQLKIVKLKHVRFS